MQNNNEEEPERETGLGLGQGLMLRQACAACKHQRKRCKKTCVLAPFFPSTMTHDFKAVQKVFGVSNVQKMVGSLETKAQQEKAIQSFIWEARCRHYNPVRGPLAEFERVSNELNLLKIQYKRVSNELNFLRNQQITMLPMPVEEGIMYQENMFSNDSRMGMDMRINNNPMNYIHGNRNLILESDQYSVAHQQVLEHEKGNQIMQSIHSLNQHSGYSVNPRYYCPDQYSQNVVRTPEDSNWDGGS